MANLYQAAANINNLEEMALKKSVIHRLHPMSKILTTLAYIIVVISFPPHNISGIAPFLFYPVILTALSDTPYKILIKRIVIALPFSLMGGISNIIFMRDISFYIGAFGVTAGMASFVSIMLKTFLAVFSALILIATTPFTEISEQLVILRVPKILCLQLVMTYRYLSVLIYEAFSMFTAYNMRSAPNNARTANKSGKKQKKQSGIKMRDMGIFLGQLILRSFDRADRVYNAMKCRGFDGAYITGTHKKPRICDILYAVFLTSAIIFLRFFNLSLFLGNIF